MKKNIWIFNHYATNMFISKGGRHYNFAKHLKNKGYSPKVFCSNIEHFSDHEIDCGDSIYKEEMAQEINVPFIFVKTSPYQGNGISRVKNMYSYYKNLFKVVKEYLKTNEKPDVIYASSVHPLTLVAGIKIAKKLKIQCVSEVRDLWPESIFVYGKLKKNSLAGKILQAGEKWIYKKSDKLIFTIGGGYDYIQDQGWGKDISKEKCYHINNGVDLEAFEKNIIDYQIQDEDLDNEDIFKIVYAGSIRPANNVDFLVEAMKLVKNPKAKLLIWGNGTDVDKIKDIISKDNITNVSYKGFVEKNSVPYILSKSNLNILHYQVEYKDVFKYGTSQNKNFEYLASNKPIVNTVDIKEKYDIIVNNNAGVTLKQQTPQAIADVIDEFCNLKEEEYNQMCLNAKEIAKEYDFKVLTDKLIQVIEN